PEAEPLLRRRRRVQYSAYLDQMKGPQLQAAALNRRLYGFKQCKVTVGKDQPLLLERLETVTRWLGSGVDIRLDAGGTWHAEQLLDRLQSVGRYSLSCVEQPLPHDELAALGELRKQSDVPIMLDESLTSPADAR